MNSELFTVNCQLSIVNCIVSIYASSNLPPCYPLAISLLPPSYPLPKKEIFCHFLHNDSLCVCIFLQTEVFRITKQKTSFL